MAKNPAIETETSAATEQAKNKQVNGTISGDTYEALENYRWENRIDRFGKVVALALEEFVENHGLRKSADAPADDK